MARWVFSIFRVGKSTMVHRPRNQRCKQRKKETKTTEGKKKDKGNLAGQTQLGSLEWKVQARSKDILPLQSSRDTENSRF